MFKFIRSFRRKVSDFIRKAASAMYSRCFAVYADCKGDLATNTLGAIIVAIVILALLVAAANAFFPGFFTRMFEALGNRLEAIGK